MPKHEPLTPKAIANRIKAKGLQKLRWYCQMCQKQCRDENGFKCHTMSESHQRQLLLFADNPDKYIDSFSREFQEGFVELLSRRFGTKRVHCNIVYQEYIQDRHHLHMNATQWETLTDFVKWLGREGFCSVDQTEKGWFVTYIDRDPETIRRQEAQAKKEKMDKDDEEQMMDFISKQVERAKKQAKSFEEPQYTELQKENEEEKVSFKMPIAPVQKDAAATSAGTSGSTTGSNSLLLTDKFPTSEKRSKSEKEQDAVSKKKQQKMTALDELIKEEEEKKERLNRKDYWLTPDIVVKIITKDLGEKFYKKKAVVQEVKDLYAGIVKVIDTGDIVKLDQIYLETVIPALGRPVKVLNGAYRGHVATLLSLNEKNFCCSVKISSGPLKDRVLDKVQYEDISKIYQDT